MSVKAKEAKEAGERSPWVVLEIGNRGSRAGRVGLCFAWLKSGKLVQFNIPRQDAEKAGLAPGMMVQFVFGRDAMAGKFAISRGETRARKLRAYYPKGAKSGGDDWSRLLLRLPDLPPLRKAFATPAGELELVDADKKGVLAFTLAK